MEAERTRGRLEAQVRETGAIEQRIAQGEREVAGTGSAARVQLAAERDTHAVSGQRNSTDRSAVRASA